MNESLRFLFDGDAGLSGVDGQTTLFVLLLAFVIGQFVGWIYMWTHRGLSYSQTFVSSLVIIPVIVSVMMLLMSGSIVVAFGLLAVFAVVRFRNVLKDTRDTTYVLWAIMQGLAVGTQRYSTAVVGALGITAVLLYLRMTGFGSRQRYDAILTLQVLGDLSAAMTTLRDTLHRHSARVRLLSEQTQQSGVTDLSYCLLMRDPSRQHELRSVLEESPCFENISLSIREDESEI